MPPPPYPGFSPSHSPASASAPGSVGAPHLPPSPQFYPPKPSPSATGIYNLPKFFLYNFTKYLRILKLLRVFFREINCLFKSLSIFIQTSTGSSLLASQLQHQSPAAAHFVNDQEEKQRLRFQIELEFVQCLGNPNYLNFLAQRGFFKDPTFINYLKYLEYWKKPQYVKFLKYPVCLHFLELLQHENFRKEIVNAQVRIFSLVKI